MLSSIAFSGQTSPIFHVRPPPSPLSFDQLQAVADHRIRKQRQSSWPNVQSAHNRLHYRQTSSCHQNTATTFLAHTKHIYVSSGAAKYQQTKANRHPPAADADEPAYIAARPPHCCWQRRRRLLTAADATPPPLGCDEDFSYTVGKHWRRSGP